MSRWDQSVPGDHQSSEGIWERLSQIAVTGAEYSSRERQPHPKCLEGTRVDLLNHIYGLLDNRAKSQLIWLHGTAGVGKSAVAFTVAERMRDLKVAEERMEKRLAGTFFFSRKYTKRCTTGYFFATLVYQLVSNFPSVREDVTRVIRDDPSLLDPNKSLRDQMEALFLQPLRRLRFRLRDCPPLAFVIDALDECTSEDEIAEIISLLGQALREPDLPVTHVLLTSRSEEHIHKAMQDEEVCPLVCEIPVRISGEGVAATISLDSADVDNDIYIFLQHSFRELQRRHTDFPQLAANELAQLARRAGRRFIVASTMMKFIDDGYNDPRDRLQLMLELTSELSPGTEVYKLYDCILSTCADPMRAYLHLSVVAALADPLPISQISKLLGSGLGRDVETALMQLRSVIDIPADSSLPVNIYHPSVRDYVSNPSNCSLPQVRGITPPHTLLADSCLRLMMREIPESTFLLDALSALKEHSQVMQPHDPGSLKQTLAFVVEPPEPLQALLGLLWLRGDRGSVFRSWLGTLDGRAWLQTQGGRDWLWSKGGQTWLQIEVWQDWLQTQDGKDWLQTQGGKDWLQTRGGKDWLQTQGGKDWLRASGGEDWLQTQGGKDWLWTESGKDWLQTQEGKGWLQTRWGEDWLQTQGGKDWLQSPGGEDWLETQGWMDWLQSPGGEDWLETQGGKDWLRTRGGRDWLETLGGKDWLQTRVGQDWLQTQSKRDQVQTQTPRSWLQTESGRAWLESESGQDWLQTESGKGWLQTKSEKDSLKTQGGNSKLQSRRGQDQLQTQPRSRPQGGTVWPQSHNVREWLHTPEGREWLRTPSGREWLQTTSGREWLQTSDGQEWLQTQTGREWLHIPGGREWLQAQGGRDWLQTQGGKEWLQTKSGRNWLLTRSGRDWLQTQSGKDWLQTPHGQAWQTAPAGSVWTTMEEFLSTLEAVSVLAVVPESNLPPAFHAIQQFKSLPDFLMFPVFLALSPQHHSTSSFPPYPDVDIVCAMRAFTIFASEARERSRLTPDAVKYACRNWVLHLSRAPLPWDDRLHSASLSFGNRHLLAWLERQWCLNGLRSCLVMLSETQKLAKDRLLQASGPSQ